MKIKKVYIKNEKVMLEVSYENESERWFGENVLNNFHSFEDIGDGFIMESDEYTMIQKELEKMQLDELEKRGFKTREEYLNSKSEKKKLGDERDILFLN